MIRLLKSKFVILVLVLYLIVVLWCVYLYAQGLTDSPLNFYFNIAYSLLFFSSTYLVWKNYGKITDPDKKWSVLFFGLATSSFGVGLLIWAFYNLVLKVEIPFPTVADVFFLAYYFLALTGSIYFLRSLKVPINKLFIYDSAVVFVLSLMVIVGIFNFVIKPQSENPLSQVINTIYPIGSGILVAIAVIGLRLNSAKMRLPLIFIALAFIFSTTADVLFSLRTNLELYWNGDIVDLMFATDGLFYFLGLYLLINENKVEVPQVSNQTSEISQP